MRQATGGRRVTLQDIARETGYSVNTVSHALRGMQDISAGTSTRIRAVADRMGYAPNQIASSLRSGRTRVIAVILGSMSNPFYGIMTDTIQDAAQEADYNLMIMCSRDDAALERQLAEQAIARRVDGILLFPTADSGPTIDRLKAAGVPLVLMSRYIAPGQADSVVCDEETGAYLAARHLIEAGRRRLAFVSSGRVVFSLELRVRGFQRACDEAGVPEADRRVIVASELPGARAGRAKGDRLISADLLMDLKRDGFDGLFLFCDVQAWHAMYAMQKHGGFAASDFGIVSFDNIEGALSFPIPLCSVNCDYARMAREGIELLRARIHADPRPPQTVVVPVDLVCRGSCRR